MALVYPMLRRHVACFQPVCTLLEEQVYNPIMAGRALHLGKINQSTRGSLMEKIERAVIPPQPAEELPEDLDDFDYSGEETEAGNDSVGGRDDETGEEGSNEDETVDGDDDWRGNNLHQRHFGGRG